MPWNGVRLSPCPGTTAQDRKGCLPSHICGASRRPPPRDPQTRPALSEVHTPILRKGGKNNFVFKDGLFLSRNHYNESRVLLQFFCGEPDSKSFRYINSFNPPNVFNAENL